MPTNCTICANPNRSDIDARLVAGTTIRDIAGHYNLSKSAVSRHKSEHIADTIAHARQSRAIEQGGTLLEQVEAIQREARTILDAVRGKDDKIALMAVSRLMQGIELMAKVQGKINDGATISLTVSPEWTRTRATILSALVPYPEARMAVVSALQMDNQVDVRP